MPSSHYAFIIKHKTYPDPFLFDISQWTGIYSLKLRFFEPNVLYCPLAMGLILKAILEKHKLRYFCEVVKEEMVIALLGKLDFKYCMENAILAIVKMECLRKLNIKRLTRSSHKLVEKVAHKAIKHRRLRVLQESHIRSNFTEDVRRTLGELRHILSTTMQLNIIKS